MTSVVQTFETSIAYPVLEGRQLSNAVGAQLDGLGEIVGQQRQGQSDDVYRLFLAGRIFANSSDATTPTIIQLVQTVFEAKSVQIVSQASAGFAHRHAPGVLGLEIGSPGIDRSLWQQALSVCKDSLAAAVRIAWVSIYDTEASFTLDGPVGGAGLDGQAITGGMAELIYNDLGA